MLDRKAAGKIEMQRLPASSWEIDGEIAAAAGGERESESDRGQGPEAFHRGEPPEHVGPGDRARGMGRRARGRGHAADPDERLPLPESAR